MKEVLETKKSRNLVAKENNLSCATVRDWIDRYQTFGRNGLHPYKTKAKYNSETKRNAVEEVLYQGASQRTVMRKYKISSSAVLRAWISNYNKQKDLKNTGSGLSEMKSRKESAKTTLQERIEIVQCVLEHDNDYQAAMKKYGVSYQQVYTWTKKYMTLGVKGLRDRRGRHRPVEELTELDRLRLENKRLRHRNEFLEMENDFAKKLQELKKRNNDFH